MTDKKQQQKVHGSEPQDYKVSAGEIRQVLIKQYREAQQRAGVSPEALAVMMEAYEANIDNLFVCAVMWANFAGDEAVGKFCLAEMPRLMAANASVDAKLAALKQQQAQPKKE